MLRLSRCWIPCGEPSFYRFAGKKLLAKKQKSNKPKTPKQVPTPTTQSKTVSKEKEEEKEEKTEKTQKATEKEVSDVQFNIDMKKADKKFDEFDDDEENPLAKLPVVKRPKAPIQKISKQKSVATTPATTARLGPNMDQPEEKKMQSERPLFPVTGNGNGSSCYVNLK
ncbi:hypothetical protein GCK72_004622 [Caenorhabditis remanei]|uniref:Uncharacterized protein n=1 Tax=Caenorhabditis remanei TaxID=31234 RepID=A0A6A5HE56_CAERE|nr:hypothetical protein GCK72_004622 [Caenorhabditis remanei]KAF1764673.1 hypothetical protein GCK72_004622 [Caenorhabditis remanei]